MIIDKNEPAFFLILELIALSSKEGSCELAHIRILTRAIAAMIFEMDVDEGEDSTRNIDSMSPLDTYV